MWREGRKRGKGRYEKERRSEERMERKKTGCIGAKDQGMERRKREEEKTK